MTVYVVMIDYVYIAVFATIEGAETFIKNTGNEGMYSIKTDWLFGVEGKRT